MNAITRRLEALRLEGGGASLAEIAKQLSKKAGCSERTIYNDFETRTRWQRGLQGLSKAEDGWLKAENRNDQIFRLASMIAHSTSNDLAKIGALNTMLKANSMLYETAVLPDILSRIKDLEDKVRKGVFVK